jgi:hypothetical protein
MRKAAIILLLFCSGHLYAQVPGFQGKRLSVEGSFIFNAALSKYNENFNRGFTALNKRMQAGLEYIIGRNVSVGTSFGVFNSGIEYLNYDYNYNITKDKYKLNCYVAGLYLKIFKFKRKGSIAPYGFYGKLGLLSVICKGEFIERDNPLNTEPPAVLDQVKGLFFNYGFGKQFIIKGRFIARVGADMAFNLSVISPLNYSSSYYLERAARKRISSAMLINLEAGLGILLF